MFRHDRTHVARGAVVVVGQRRNDHRRTRNAVSFVGEFLIVLIAHFARRFFDRAFDVVVRHVRRFRFRNYVGKFRVGRGVGIALCGNRKLSAEFGENFTARSVRLALLCLNIVPFAMT